jgi:glucan phosphoethanolaminetransferase (alkaline phosphatase superfamily)
MKPNYRIILTILIILTVLCAAVIPGMGLVSTLIHYTGTCYGFTDGSWSCPWGEFLKNQISYMLIVSLPLLFFLFVGWLLTLFFWMLSRVNHRFSTRIQTVNDRAAVILLGLTGLLLVCYSLLIGISILTTLFTG